MPLVADTIDGLRVTSGIGKRKQRDRFSATDTPTHDVAVENRNGEACDVEVEICSLSQYVLVEGRKCWRSTKLTHGGLRSKDRTWPYPATLTFTQADPGRPQVIRIRIYMAASWWPDSTPLPRIGELRHTIWVS